jgi:3',5'-nucleoside bisphosphate phosphatase
MQADLHAHSSASDGLATPVELVRRAHGAGLAAVALTDHDTIAGLAEGRAEAGRLGLQFVPGCEVSVVVGRHDIHLLAFCVDPAHPRLSALLRDMDGMRRERVRETVARLRDAGVPLDEERVWAQARESHAVGRLHVARALVAGGHVGSVTEAFARYLGRNGCAHVPKRTLSIEETIAAVWAAGAVPVLAHPGLYAIEDPERVFADWDLAGIEVRHPGHDAVAEERFARWAVERDWVATGGSDWHGETRAAGYLGCRTVGIATIGELERRRRAGPS